LLARAHSIALAHRGAQVRVMTGDSRSNWDVLGRLSALRGAAPVFACAISICGCAFSFEDGGGQRQVVGLFSIAQGATNEAAAGDVHRFGFYGVWVDDAFRGTALAVGEVQLTVADLRNQWNADGAHQIRAGDCDGDSGFGFRWCSLPEAEPGRGGVLFDIAVAGVSVGVGARDRHFGVGYHRQTLIEVMDENALIAWPALPAFAAASAGGPVSTDAGGEPAQASVQELLRGSING
jgi:hypothetical protein